MYNLYPFGSVMSSFNPNETRYGFNGKEKDLELNGEGNTLDFGARIYDGRIGKFLSKDPWEDKYPWQTPYAYFANSPIAKIDWNGLGGDERVKKDKKNKQITIDLKFDYKQGENQSDKEYAEAKQKHMDQICNDLNGQQAKIKGQVYNVVVNISEGGGRNSIRVNFDKTLQRSNAVKNGFVQNINPNRDDATHETLHNLGLSDRYSYTQYASSIKDEAGNKIEGGKTQVGASYRSIAISLKLKEDPEYFNNESENMMLGGKMLTKVQWKHIVGRRAERQYNQTTYFHTGSKDRYTVKLTNYKGQEGYWDINSNFHSVPGYNGYFNIKTGRGSENKGMYNNGDNDTNLAAPYE